MKVVFALGSIQRQPGAPLPDGVPGAALAQALVDGTARLATVLNLGTAAAAHAAAVTAARNAAASLEAAGQQVRAMNKKKG